jgi:hypothetical protein
MSRKRTSSIATATILLLAVGILAAWEWMHPRASQSPLVSPPAAAPQETPGFATLAENEEIVVSFFAHDHAKLYLFSGKTPREMLSFESTITWSPLGQPVITPEKLETACLLAPSDLTGLEKMRALLRNPPPADTWYHVHPVHITIAYRRDGRLVGEEYFQDEPTWLHEFEMAADAEDAAQARDQSAVALGFDPAFFDGLATPCTIARRACRVALNHSRISRSGVQPEEVSTPPAIVLRSRSLSLSRNRPE